MPLPLAPSVPRDLTRGLARQPRPRSRYGSVACSLCSFKFKRARQKSVPGPEISTPQLVSVQRLTPVEMAVRDLGDDSEMRRAKRVEAAVKFWRNQSSFHLSPERKMSDVVDTSMEVRQRGGGETVPCWRSQLSPSEHASGVPPHAGGWHSAQHLGPREAEVRQGENSTFALLTPKSCTSRRALTAVFSEEDLHATLATEEQEHGEERRVHLPEDTCASITFSCSENEV